MLASYIQSRRLGQLTIKPIKGIHIEKEEVKLSLWHDLLFRKF